MARPGGSQGRRRRRGSDRWLPFAYAGVALLVVAFVLPSALRPPPGTTVGGAEYSPNAPPNAKAQTVIKTAEQPGSATAGQKPGPGSASTTSTIPSTTLPAGAATTTTLAPASLFGCAPGNPPLQWPSVYAVACEPAFTGNNGGATGTGVSATQINIVVSYFNQNPSAAGPVTAVTAKQNSYIHTLYDMAEYFNAHAEMYNRTIQLYYTNEAAITDSESTQISDTDTTISTYHPLAALVAGTSGEIGEYSKAHVVTDQFEELNQHALAADAPYAWGQNGPSEDAQMAAEFLCKEIKGGAPLPGVTTGSPTFKPNAPRTFGSIETGASGYGSGPELLSGLATCGISPDDTTVAPLDTKGMEQTILKLKDSGVTTVILNTDILDAIVAMSDAASVQYTPEWVTTGFGLAVDDPSLMRGVPAQEMAHLYGLYSSQYFLNTADDECWKAVDSVEPGFSPDVGTCHLYWEMFNHLADAIELTGPHLNSDTLAAAYQNVPQVALTPATSWAMAGSFADPAASRSWTKSAAVYWWDATGKDADGNAGTWALADCGKRYYAGEIPSRPAHLFTTTGYVTGLTFGHCT